jgi:hypothetical protein
MLDDLKGHLAKKIAGNGLEKYSAKLVEFVEYRMLTKGITKYKTVHGINGLVRDSKNCLNAGLDLNDCIDITIERGWLTPDIKYFVKERPHAGTTNQRKPEYTKAPDIFADRNSAG